MWEEPTMNRPTLLLASTLCLGIVLALMALGRSPARAADITITKHNLSSSGPGTVKSSSGAVCLFCHTPHASNPIAPLWNRNDPGTYYQTYESSTLKATVGQPTGSSRLCLSCHDGTIALTQTYNSRNAPGGPTVYISAADRGYIGTDLSDDHPISFGFDASLAISKGELRHPSTLPVELPLDHNGQLQCTTCHDAHDDTYGQFLRMDNRQSRMCRTCHEISGWDTSSHAQSPALLSSSTWDNWDNLRVASVRDAACETCHRPHSAGGRQRLLRHEAEESNCINCHDGSVANTNIASAMQQISAHPVQQTTGVHDPTERPSSMREHVECADCHDPHQVRQGTAATFAPDIKPSMRGASGVTGSGQELAQASYEYQVCYKCHAQQNVATEIVSRTSGTNDIADEFSPVNMSYHPVESQGRNLDVPSLLQSYRTTDQIYCSDCHSSSNPSYGKGPHGSAYRPLLASNYTTGSIVSESPHAYALCYKCHSRASILGDQSFDEHNKHIVDEQAPCSVCHDPHGVRENANLINFDRNVVAPSARTGTGPTYSDLGNGRGSCVLLCHGEDHDGSED
jgi:predicted CXXCH cytochrome family protein